MNLQDVIHLVNREVPKPPTCMNPACNAPPGDTALVTTGHVRWFCTVECLIESRRAHLDRISAAGDVHIDKFLAVMEAHERRDMTS
jgi:hypothetical protein